MGIDLEQAVQLAKTQGGQIPPLGWLTYDYHQQLTLVMKHGRLPPDVQKGYEKWLKTTERSRGEGRPQSSPPTRPTSSPPGREV
jgi:hypothetical protein